MITCQSFVDRGFMRVLGLSPNGNAVVTREVDGMPSVLLRGGARVVNTGGISLDDTEAPLGVPLTYRVSVSGIAAEDRIAQQNLMPTPTFIHGVQGWTPGLNRTLSVVADATAHSASVGLVSGNATFSAPSAPPTLVGHVDSTVFAASSYTLTPATTGGTAIVTNDWMVLIHQQQVNFGSPATPAGWTLRADGANGTVRETIWVRRRQVGDTGVTVAAAAGSAGIGTLLWVRGAVNEVPLTATRGVTLYQINAEGLILPTATVSALRPSLAIGVFNADTISAETAPNASSLSGGGTWQYTRNSGTASRTMTVATKSSPDSGETAVQYVTYGAPLQGAVSTVVVFQSDAVGDRVIAKAKTTALPAAELPYLLTGRFRFLTPGLRLWSDVKAVGTWQQVKTAYATWLIARGVESTLSGDFLQLFLTIVNPADQTDYIAPIQVRLGTEHAVNQWTDFSVLFTPPPGGIPATAEIRLSHGASTKQYAVQWYLDEFGITPGSQRGHETMYWFDGDSALPADPLAYQFPGWTASPGAAPATISWAGTVGNSISTLTEPSAIETTTTCQLDVADTALLLPCEPVLLSDPINVNLASWVGLIHLDPLVYPSKQTVHQIINRAPAVVISQVRGWATGRVTVLTMTAEARAQLLTVMASGRVLLIRNPIPDYPENNWYIACGDLSEDRPVPNQRVTVREWTYPFVRVERPSGLIEASSGITWQQVKDSGTWAALRNARQDWLAVLAGDSVG